MHFSECPSEASQRGSSPLCSAETHVGLYVKLMPSHAGPNGKRRYSSCSLLISLGLKF